MTTDLEAPKGFEARLLHALTEIDAARPTAPAAFSPAPARRTRRIRRPVAIIAATLIVAGGGTAMASVSGLFDPAPPSVQHIFAGLNGHGRSIDAGAAVRIGVIDDHVAYAAPTSGGGFCLYFGQNPERSGPTGGSCIYRGAAPGEVVFSVLPGTDGDLLFGRVGTASAQTVTATFPRSGQTVTAPVADSGFFVVNVPGRSARSLEIAIPATPDPNHPEKNVPTKDGGPILSFQPDRVAEISVTALDGQGHVVGHGVAITQPEPGPTSTAGPLR
jgi:hypothetical protein